MKDLDKVIEDLDSAKSEALSEMAPVVELSPQLSKRLDKLFEKLFSVLGTDSPDMDDEPGWTVERVRAYRMLEDMVNRAADEVIVSDDLRVTGEPDSEQALRITFGKLEQALKDRAFRKWLLEEPTPDLQGPGQADSEGASQGPSSLQDMAMQRL